MARTVMIMGLGGVGATALEFLARSEGVDRLVTCDINEEYGAYRTNVAAVGATCQGFSKKYEFHRCDINDVDGTARLLREVKPDVILLSVAVESRRELKAAPLPQRVRDNINTAGIAGWLPWNLLLPTRFTRAVMNSGIETHFINSSISDIVNPALWKRFGYGPTCGAGNMARLAANITKYVSDEEGVPIRDLTVCMVGSHALGIHGAQAGVPFFLKLLLGDRDITGKYDVMQLVDNCMTNFRWKVEQKYVMAPFPLFSALYVRNIMAIVRDTREYVHVPGPMGLPGGYPVRLGAKGAELALPRELTREQAIKINEESNKFDGVEEIKDDGTIVFTDKVYSAMKELGYDCRELPPDDLEARSEELRGLKRRLIAEAG
ncbi:MAG: hypothetical protein HY675_12630 [Chloroflexi bacterium]|nr:hypothetical protein [Chloroflexota bacterium]